MGFKKIIEIILGKWIIPVVAFVPVLFAFIILGLSRSSIAENMGIVILCLGLIWLLCSTVYQFYKKKWLLGVATIVIAIGGTFVAFIVFGILSIMITMIDGDGWADNLTIPDNITLNYPKGEGYGNIRPDSILNITRTKTDFELYKSFQPGIYHYDFWTGKIEKGTIYLKVFEITQDFPLTTKGLAKTSIMEIQNSTDSILRFSTKTDFTIYEGDWGKPYAARFEVWFKSDNSEIERKLTEKNYVIEGWQH